MKKIAKKTAHSTNSTSHATEGTIMKKTKKTAKKATRVTDSTQEAASNAASSVQAAGSSASTTPAPSPSTSLSDVPIQLQALEQRCGYGDPLPDDARKTSEELVRRVPSSIVDRIIALAVRGNGVVAGITFDPNAAKSALTQADEADAVATAGQMLVRRAQDQAIRLRAGVTGNASAIRTALRGYVKTAQGASLVQENDELRTLAKQHAAARKARATRAKKGAEAATEAANPATETEAPAETPAPVPVAAPAPKAS
jgi:hypothetical protein